MASFGERLKGLRGKLSQENLAKELGVVQTSYSNYERDKADPPLFFIDNILSKFEVKTDWLLFGRGPKHREVSASDSPTEFQSLLREYCRLQQENTELRQIVAKLKAEKGSVCQNGE